MAEMANGLLHKHKELDLIPRNHIKNLMSDMPTMLIAERQKQGDLLQTSQSIRTD